MTVVDDKHDPGVVNRNDVMTYTLPVADAFGPAKVIQVNEPGIGLQGVLVIDNVARGPAIGGLRMAPDVSVEECLRLARAMTLKNAAAGIPHGGGKSVLWGDPRMPQEAKARLIRTFAHALRNETDYIFGPDMGTDETAMAWVHDEIGRSVGLPAVLGGIPLDELGATGWGVRHAADVAVAHCGFPLHGARFAVQGFGAVGRHAARFLAECGAVLVAASDSQGTLINPGGLDVANLERHKLAGQPLHASPAGRGAAQDAIIDVECDLWIPAARPDVLDEGNAGRLRSRIVVQGANIPVTPGAEALLARRGVLVVPDFIANAGGVICAAMEYAGATQAAAFDAIAERIRDNTRAVLDRSRAEGLLPRAAGLALAGARVREAMSYRRFGLL